MRLLNWYVTKGFLFAFFMAIAILTFAMTGANLVKVLDYVSRGIPAVVFGRFTLYILPIILTFTVPWAVMVAVMLLFGRLSADSEIVAMRACGVSILQRIDPAYNQSDFADNSGADCALSLSAGGDRSPAAR